MGYGSTRITGEVSQAQIERERGAHNDQPHSPLGEYVINGSKWWITGAGSLHCEIMILMGKTDTSAALHRQQSQILVPMSTPGITLLRPMMAFGDDDAPKVWTDGPTRPSVCTPRSL